MAITRRGWLKPVLATVVATTTLLVHVSATAGGCIETSLEPASVAALKPSDAMVAITAPHAGETLVEVAPNESVTFSVDYWGPRLVSADRARAVDDYHLVYILDEDASRYIGTLQVIPVCDQLITHSIATRVTFDKVSHGRHALVVLLAGSNNVSVNPPVMAGVTFTVK